MPHTSSLSNDTAARYQRSWSEMMTRIWTDRIRLLGAFRTGRLHRSVVQGASRYGAQAQLVFRFVQYGIYVDRGTGKGYRRGNGGTLQIKDKAYRKVHGLGAERQRRPWFSIPWAISRRRLATEMTRQYADSFVALFDE